MTYKKSNPIWRARHGSSSTCPVVANSTTCLGSLLVQEIDGDRFRIGSGFSDAERADPPAIGSIVTFKYHGRTKNGLPRFASFLRMAEQP